MPKVSLDSIAPIKVQSVADHVVDQLERLIRNGHFPSGNQLPSEQDLAVALQVGRSTVREAKQILIAKGLLITRGRAGTFVASIRDRDDVSEVVRALRDPSHLDLSEVREVIEVPAIRMASVRATAHQIAAMHATIEDIEYQTFEQKTQAWARSLEIHRLIVRASNNRVLSSIYELITQVLLRTQVPYLPYIADWQEEVASHRRLIDVLVSGDPDAAAAEMVKHLHHSDQYRRDLLEADEKDLVGWNQAARRIRANDPNHSGHQTASDT